MTNFTEIFAIILMVPVAFNILSPLAILSVYSIVRLVQRISTSNCLDIADAEINQLQRNIA